MKWQVVKSRPLHRLGHRPNRCSKQHIAIVPDAEIMLRCKVQRDRSTGLRDARQRGEIAVRGSMVWSPSADRQHAPCCAALVIARSGPLLGLQSCTRVRPFSVDASGQSRKRMLRRKVSSHGVYSGGLLSCHAVVAGGTREPNNIGIDWRRAIATRFIDGCGSARGRHPRLYLRDTRKEIHD